MEQALALPENMEYKELNARLREIAEERESIRTSLDRSGRRMNGRLAKRPG